ncbi:MAG: hypothetical protein ACYC63_15575 [Armatimonadota bacterium]
METTAEQIEQRVQDAMRTLTPKSEPASVTEFASLATTGTWIERWPDGDGGEEQRAVTAKVWNASLQACLDRHDAVHLPAAETPYYLDGPIILKSGQRLSADPNAEIRLKPDTSTCMVRNEHVVSGRYAPLPPDLQPDTDITIEGGIWTSLMTSPTQTNGNSHARADAADSLPGSYGLFLLQNVSRVRVSNLVIRQGKVFGLHLSAISDFLIENIRFESHGRDGVHVNGPASYGVIRDIGGVTRDDLVALNAWDWLDSTTSFGPIDHILVECISGAPLSAGAADAIRLLPGVKHFPSGATLDCPVTNCVLRDITDIREFKLYDQPNLEMGRDKDFSDPMGTLRNIRLERLVFTRPGTINVATTTDNLSIEDVEFRFDLSANPDYRLVEIGPMSMTWKMRPGDPSTWVEVFSPDCDVTVRGFALTNARLVLDEETTTFADPMTRLVSVRDMHVNPDYPKTTPRGGTGKARLLPPLTD